jgi:hypothetical protein
MYIAFIYEQALNLCFQRGMRYKTEVAFLIVEAVIEATE